MAFTIRSQVYAQKIYGQFTQLLKKSGFPKGEFSRVCKRFPILVKTNGLMQTVAFFHSKASGSSDKKSEQSKAFEVFLEKLKEVLELPNASSTDTIHGYLSSNDCSSENYMLLTKKALDVGLWYKRYAEILITD